MPSFDPEEEVIRYTQELIRTRGFGGDVQEVADLHAQRMRALEFDEVWTDEVGNTIGVRHGSHSGPRLLFDAHLDTVEVGDPAAWHHDPFGGEISAGRIWGRGSADDKGSLASLTVGLASVERADLCGEVYAVGSVGEEPLEGAALNYVLDAVKPDAVIIAEPTDCRVATGHKGRARVDLNVQGRSCHSSTPEEGENAIEKAVEAIRRVRRMPPLKDPLLGSSVMEPIQIISKPFPSSSTIPYACQVVFDRRMVRGETEASVLELYQQTFADLQGISIEFEHVTLHCFTGRTIQARDFHPAWALDPASGLVQLAVEALNAAGIPPVTYTADFCSNAASSAGERRISTVVFGPGSVLNAHAVDEFCPLDGLVRSSRAFAQMARVIGRRFPHSAQEDR